MTSHDVVDRVRREQERGVKVGHAGTLDPFATGLLLVLIGRATRVQRWLMELPKELRGARALRLERRRRAIGTGRSLKGRCRESLELPTGVIRQTPPAYSAIKIGGKRAYELARAGEEFELPEREVTVYEATLSAERPGNRDRIATRCSSGTYIRSLIADLERRLLREAAPDRDRAVPRADAGTFLPLNDAVAFIPEVRLTGDDARRATHGVAVPGRGEGIVRLTDDDGLIALAEPREDGMLKPIVGFRPG